jgi:hypothetical protein
MQFKLYLELATRTQDAALLELLRFPDHAALKSGDWSARWWSHGKTKRMRSADREKILARLADDGVNELEFKWRSRDIAEASDPVRLVELWFDFVPSRVSALWSPVPTQKLASHADERNRINFGSGKLPGYYSKCRLPYPSALLCFFTFEYREDVIKDDHELLERLIEWIRMSFSPRLDPLQVFGHGGRGSVDAGPGNFFHGPMLHGMRSVGPWTDRLGEKFENIYPIMIGPVASCEGLAAALGDRCSLIRISEQATNAIVSISPDEVEDVRHDPTVKKWVLIRDVNEIDQPQELLAKPGYESRQAMLDEIYRQESSRAWLAPFVKR